ncbi:MAG: hypothetical protein LLG05_08455 [Porphyromonadaceae bacterium]|nr:hypothetical protein [Porphyromonadaceae bacterium]
MTTIEKAAGEYASKIDEETKSSLHPKTASFQGFIAGAEFVHPIDWEQRRYELAKETSLVLMKEWAGFDTKEGARRLIEFADELINQLKNNPLK